MSVSVLLSRCFKQRIGLTGLFKSILLLSLFLPISATHAKLLSLKGDRTQGSLLLGKVTLGSQVKYKKKIISVNDSGFFVIGFGRDAALDQQFTVISPDGQQQAHKLKLKKRQYNIQRIKGVPQKMVTPPESFLKRIRRESKLVAASRAVASNSPYFAQPFIWPLTGRISGVYGSQRVFNGEPRRPHFGVDVAAPVGTKVISPAGGTVVLAEPDLYFSGGTLIIDHGHGVFSSFLHLSKVLVKVGTKVKQGDVIAKVGATGRVTGPHLDWRMNWFTTRVDPALWVGPMPKK
ncbi:M23 family metallopeptidase [Zooshikella harenae]|uniref:M23 family metallopeptidase n=1 Tax=Zooshikella harenae TaxID=2827238 RepID=A0ABS5ZF62_9GAMM|nr:M23 family metallopeptidase [Zooshikella harenae]MBU2712704.1 M23 family metallopeptidase [Zooshikella harenae]